MRIAVLALLGVLIGGAAARADDGPHIITAFAVTRPGDPPARIIEFYGQGQASRMVQQPTATVIRRHAQRG